jgi:hypothetical protein
LGSQLLTTNTHLRRVVQQSQKDSRFSRGTPAQGDQRCVPRLVRCLSAMRMTICPRSLLPCLSVPADVPLSQICHHGSHWVRQAHTINSLSEHGMCDGSSDLSTVEKRQLLTFHADAWQTLDMACPEKVDIWWGGAHQMLSRVMSWSSPGSPKITDHEVNGTTAMRK